MDQEKGDVMTLEERVMKLLDEWWYDQGDLTYEDTREEIRKVLAGQPEPTSLQSDRQFLDRAAIAAMHSGNHNGHEREWLARYCWDDAEAMLAERKRRMEKHV
jgi:transcription initiation factor TFIID subunit TAF12